MKVCTVEFKPSFTSKLFIIILEKHLLYFHFRCRNRPFPLYRWLSVGRWVTIHTNTGRLQISTRATRQYFWWRGFFFLWRLVWTASALDHLLICCLAPNTEDVIISSAYQRCRVHIVRYCVAAELEDFDRDSRTDGLVYMAMFLEFLRQSKTSLWNTLGTLKKRNTPRR